eukprot:206370-Chlamydomonas_euryale.AAC.2
MARSADGAAFADGALALKESMAHAVASGIDGAAFGVLIGMVWGALSSGMHPSPAAMCALHALRMCRYVRPSYSLHGGVPLMQCWSFCMDADAALVGNVNMEGRRPLHPSRQSDSDSELEAWERAVGSGQSSTQVGSGGPSSGGLGAPPHLGRPDGVGIAALQPYGGSDRPVLLPVGTGGSV